MVQIGANIIPHNNLSHFDTFGHGDWYIKCLEHWQNWVLIPYLTILSREQFKEKIIIFIGENWWTEIDVFLIGKGLPDMHNHEFGQNWPEEVVCIGN